MTDIEPLEFSSNAQKNMVSVEDKPTAPPPESTKEPAFDTYDAQRENLTENNVDKEQMMELATPLSEVMGPDPMEQQQMQQQQPQQMMAPAPMQDMPMQPPAPTTPMAMEQPSPPASTAAKKKNIGGLTDEQVDALLVGLVAAVAFSPQLKSKMMDIVPTLFNDAGSRTAAGVAVTGLIAGGLYLGAKRLIN